jgi:hypothetical protein
MEALITGLAVAIAIGLTTPIVLALRRVSRRAFERDEAMRAHWQELATAHPLIFTPGRYRAWGVSEVAYLVGSYRGHDLKLDSFERVENLSGQGETRYVCTRLVFSVRGEAEELPSAGIEVLAGQAGVEALAGQDQAVNRQPAEASTPTFAAAEASTLLAEYKPTPLETIGRLLSSVSLSALKGDVTLQANGSQFYYEQPRIETDVAYLQLLLDTLCDLAGCYVQILDLGGEAVPKLQEFIRGTSPKLQNAAVELIRGIAQESGQQFGHRYNRLLCPRCLAHYAPYKVSLPEWQTATYYGCRQCSQSRIFWEGQVVARLDQEMSQKWLVQEELIQVNWLAHRRLFDFDAIAIAQAGDQEVERFAIQVGNDTDEQRQPRYKQMRCVVATECGLSENTMRILQRIFGQVEQIAE